MDILYIRKKWLNHERNSNNFFFQFFLLEHFYILFLCIDWMWPLFKVVITHFCFLANSRKKYKASKISTLKDNHNFVTMFPIAVLIRIVVALMSLLQVIVAFTDLLVALTQLSTWKCFRSFIMNDMVVVSIVEFFLFLNVVKQDFRTFKMYSIKKMFVLHILKILQMACHALMEGLDWPKMDHLTSYKLL